MASLIALAHGSVACDENFNDIYIGPQGGAAGTGGQAAQGGGAGSAGSGNACSASRCQQGSFEACENGSYAVATVCSVGCDGKGCITVEKVSLGGAQSCAVLSDKSVRCWGANNLAQLGAGKTSASEVKPIEIAALAGVSEIALGASHGCALRDGKVLCWGDNSQGQCGVALTTSVQMAPAEVALPMVATRVATGMQHSCALLQDGSVACWGSNAQGQLGVASPADRSASPVTVASLKGVTSLGLGGRRSCAALATQGLMCWGEAPTTEKASLTFAPTPLSIPGTASVQEMSLGEFHLCWQQPPAGTVRCSGANESGQLGSGTTTPTSVSTVIDGGGAPITQAGSLGAGSRHQCAVLDDSETIQCWGDNELAQLGAVGGDEPEATTVPDVVDAQTVACGAQHCCAIADAGQKLWCWGSNATGQLGRADIGAREPDAVSW